MKRLLKYLMKHRVVLEGWRSNRDGAQSLFLALVGIGIFFLAWVVGGHFVFIRPQFS